MYDMCVLLGMCEFNMSFGSRHCQAFMTFLCLVLAYSMRVNLSVGIVAMTDSKGSNPDFMVLPWSTTRQGIILSSFFWGYLITQIPAGHMARKFGPKYLLFGAMLVCSVFTLLSPFIAENCSWMYFCLTRVVQGLAQGFFFPCVNTHMAKWAPPPERSRIFSFVFGGTQLGTVVTLFVAGYLAAGPWGWPSIFYSTGLCGVLWAVAWLFLGANSPDTHPSISDSEREYIKAALVSSSDQSSTMRTPWRDIVTSVPLWALLIAHLGQNWGFWMLLTMLPNYLSHVLGFNIKSNGLFSSIPYMVMWSLTIVFSWIADYINEKRLLPLNVSRKMWNTIAHWGGAAALVALSLISTSVTGAVVLLTVSVALNAGVYTGFLTNHLDLSPNFAGLLMGITNGMANVTSILSPMITGFIVSDQVCKLCYRQIMLQLGHKKFQRYRDFCYTREKFTRILVSLNLNVGVIFRSK
ncbi:putative inorganic phosphate cotransporter isoform X1 [Homalodisca vitripennis]|uniref:putative inorganic phosphate cotransporter isoform X1 n=2 Tax=Homalodisca vitripennis TaxID=197043 RepID=UPI001EEB1F35|nr:putative inorganic phosphate cotransporter isoform X1 [Homalodisca vitripennis]